MGFIRRCRRRSSVRTRLPQNPPRDEAALRLMREQGPAKSEEQRKEQNAGQPRQYQHAQDGRPELIDELRGLFSVASVEVRHS